jgi:TatD DNase family protein
MNEEPVARGFDFHCHIDLYPDPVAMIASCEENRIVTLAMTTTPKAWPQNRQWAAQSVYTHTAVGLHPEVVGERHRELPLLEQYMKESRLVGEIGLDGSPQYRKSWNEQTIVFTRALATAQRLGGRVVSIHSRRAANEVVRCLQEHTTPERVLPILHWFSGSAVAARKAVSLGCYFSINHCTLGNDAGIALVRSLPQERLLTETDGPLTSLRDRESEPPDVVMITERLGAVRSLPAQDMRTVIRTNAQRVFAFAGLSTGVLGLAD